MTAQNMEKEELKQLSVGATVRIGMGSGLGVVILMSAAILVIRRRQRQKSSNGIINPMEPPYPDMLP